MQRDEGQRLSAAERACDGRQLLPHGRRRLGVHMEGCGRIARMPWLVVGWPARRYTRRLVQFCQGAKVGWMRHGMGWHTSAAHRVRGGGGGAVCLPAGAARC